MENTELRRNKHYHIMANYEENCYDVINNSTLIRELQSNILPEAYELSDMLSSKMEEAEPSHLQLLN